jgi:hypothetical protein
MKSSARRSQRTVRSPTRRERRDQDRLGIVQPQMRATPAARWRITSYCRAAL